MHHAAHHMIVHHASFWPSTLGAWGATLAAITAPIAAVASVLNRGKISVVHDMVNGRLTQSINALASYAEQAQPGGRRATDPPATDTKLDAQ